MVLKGKEGGGRSERSSLTLTLSRKREREERSLLLLIPRHHEPRQLSQRIGLAPKTLQ